jgi:hypothetical protein
MLRERTGHLCVGSATICEVPISLLERAAAMLEYLESTAGAVTPGESFTEIAQNAGRRGPQLPE